MDNYERECERKEEIKKTEKDIIVIAERMKDIFNLYKEYLSLRSKVLRAGYRVEDDNDLKIWKQIL